MIAPEVVARAVASGPLHELVSLLVFVAEGLVGTAVVLVLPAVVYVLAIRHDRRTKEPTSDVEVVLTNHFLDKQIERERGGT